VNDETLFSVYCKLPSITPVVDGVDEDLEGESVSQRINSPISVLLYHLQNVLI